MVCFTCNPCTDLSLEFLGFPIVKDKEDIETEVVAVVVADDVGEDFSMTALIKFQIELNLKQSYSRVFKSL